jgi:hypothetical protein
MNGVEAWRTLEEKYQARGTAGKAFLHSQMIRARYEPKGDPEIYFHTLESSQTRLRQLGHEISDDMLLGIAMEALPTEISDRLMPVLDGIEDLTYDHFKMRVRTFYERNVYQAASKKDSGTPKALWIKDGEKKLMKCWGCGEVGHPVMECPHNLNQAPKSKTMPFKQKKASEDGEKNTKWKPATNKHNSKKKKFQGRGAGKDNLALTAFLASDLIKGGQEKCRINFVVDSGATTHMITDKTHIEDIVYEQVLITVAGGRVLKSIGKGNLKVIICDSEGDACNVTLHEVLIVPELGVNLLSVRKMSAKGAQTVFNGETSYIKTKGGIEFPIVHHMGLCVLRCELPGDYQDPVAYTVSSDQSKLWHRRFGHAGLNNFAKVEGEDIEVPASLKGDEECDVCELGKQTHISFPKSTERHATEPFENVHVDLLGRMDEPSIGGAEFAAVFTDEHTRYVIVKPIEVKADFISSFQRVVSELRALGFRVRGLRSDRGGEFISSDLRDYCQERAIAQTYSGPYAPQQQGISERMNRTLTEMVRCMLVQSGLPKELWAEAFNTAAYLVNRIPDENGLSPYYKVFKRHPKINHLRAFGCRVFVQVPKSERSKLDPKAWSGILVGYDTSNWRCYRIWDPATRTLRLAVHVSFHENVFPMREMIEAQYEEPYEELVPWPSGDLLRIRGAPLAQPEVEAVIEPAAVEEAHEPAAEEKTAEPGAAPLLPQVIRRPLLPRKAKLTNLNQAMYSYEDCYEEMAFSVMDSVMDDPKTMEEALRSPYRDHWIGAMKKEFESLKATGTWRLVQLPKGAHPVGGKWVFKTKRNEKGEIIEFRARWVAKGYSQKPGVDYLETYAPVARMASIRAVLSLAAKENWELANMDVNSAFLNSHITEEVYVVQPNGFEETGPNGEKLVCRMQKCLYGLKQAPRNWNAVIDAWMVSYGFAISAADPCVYVYHSNLSTLVVMLWVDDLIIAGSNQKTLSDFKSAISRRFKMKDLGELTWILGMEVKRDRVKGTIEITQKAYIELMLQRFGMEDCKPIGTPIEGYLQRTENVGPNQDYMSLVGSLLYAAIVTRPDIAYAVQALGRHMQNSTDEHYSAGKRILRYLQGTKELGLKYGGSSNEEGVEVIGFADADWGSDKDTRRSVTAYVFMLGGAAISWGSKLQPTVALSTSEAEYMAASSAVQEAMHLRLLMRSLGYEKQGYTVIYEDNQGAVGLSENPILHKRSKHIDIKYHYVRERVSAGDVKLIYITTEEQLADLLTKPLLKPRLVRLRDQVLGQAQ